MRASYRCSRTGSAKHNDRDFDTSKAMNIFDGQTQNNLHQHCFSKRFPDMTFAEVEALFYEKRYQGYIDALNERYRKSGHPERCKSIQDLLKGTKTRPEEFILQIGSQKDGFPDAKILSICASEFCNELNKWSREHGHHMHILNYAIHVDESTPHIHVRRIWDCEDKYGNIRINQEQALKASGIERPDLSKPDGRYNNRKISFDKMAREMWQDIIKSHGLEIETKPLPTRKHQITEAFINMQIAEKMEQVAQLESKLNKLNKQIEWTKELRKEQQNLGR